MSKNPDPRIELLRHAVATLAYRGGKALRGAPASFADFQLPGGSRPPVALLAHIGDLLDWSLTLAARNSVWHDATPGAWESEVERFFDGLARLDALLATAAADLPVETLLQGPIADALTHVGQLTMLRRQAGAPILSESYAKADIAAGRVGPEQAAPPYEFD